MSGDTEKILNAMKAQAWERAKGELNGLASASYAPAAAKTNADWHEWEAKCQKRRELIAAFVKDMEEEELHLA